MEQRTHETHNAGPWGRTLLNVTWVCLLVVAAAEASIFAILLKAGYLDNPADYAISYILLPCTAYVTTLTLVHLLSIQLIRRGYYTAQGTVYVIGISIICFVLVWVHHAVAAIYALFCLPVFLSLIYINKMMLLRAFLINMALFVIFALFPPPNASFSDLPDFVEMISAGALILASYPISLLILRRLRSLVDEVRKEHHRTRLDSLTKLYNHASFYETLDEDIQRHNVTGQNFTLILLDIDNFKMINDQYGHDTGDQVLLLLVEAIRKALDETAQAFRYGGEEFTILTQSSLEDSARLTQSILTEFKRSSTVALHRVTVTASAGLCAYDANRFGAKREFFAAADEALYSAKRMGKDRLVVWNENLRRQVFAD